MFRSLAVITALLLGSWASAQDGVSGPLGVELNKLEEFEGGVCRAFFLFRNETGRSFGGFEMSLAVLDTAGVIDQLVTVDAAPLPAGRTTLKLFELPQTQCGTISQLLLHEVGRCQPQNADPMDCFDFMVLESKASVALVK